MLFYIIIFVGVFVGGSDRRLLRLFWSWVSPRCWFLLATVLFAWLSNV